MPKLPEYIDGLPNICGAEHTVEAATPKRSGTSSSVAHFDHLKSACAVALHMHQPLIPAGGKDMRTAAFISNLQHMIEHPHVGDNHNASVFRECYKRMGELLPQLVDEGKAPRISLDYSGTLLHGLRQLDAGDVFDALQVITCDPDYVGAAEWLGTTWGHATAPSTPVQDFRLHVKAWRHHFAAIFGTDALQRVRGFAPAYLALPNHPDVAYEFVKTLKECGYQWVVVPEQSVEKPHTGRETERKHLPHRLVCQNSYGDFASIIAIIKTQGSDPKLVGQMQPYEEARNLSRWELHGRLVPPLVTQIGDGENGGVMMNEFPPRYADVIRRSHDSDVAVVNVSDYLNYLSACGIEEVDLPTLQPRGQKRVWEHFNPGLGREKLAEVIDGLKKSDSQFYMDCGSWTNNREWLHRYSNALGPLEEVSALFFERVLKPNVPTSEPRYRTALFHLLVSQTSCYRHWGQGLWMDYGREVCRRAKEVITQNF